MSDLFTVEAITTGPELLIIQVVTTRSELFTVEVVTTGPELLITQVVTLRSDLFTVEAVTTWTRTVNYSSGNT
jgi:hypothetical protein